MICWNMLQSDVICNDLLISWDLFTRNSFLFWLYKMPLFLFLLYVLAFWEYTERKLAELENYSLQRCFSKKIIDNICFSWAKKIFTTVIFSFRAISCLELNFFLENNVLNIATLAFMLWCCDFATVTLGAESQSLNSKTYFIWHHLVDAVVTVTKGGYISDSETFEQSLT